MNKFENLTDDNLLMYQMKSYDNPQCHTYEEFVDDMKRVKYIKRLFYRYHTKKILKERLIINHLIILYNVLGNEAATRVLFLKIDKNQHYILKTFLLFINKMPNRVFGICGNNINSTDIGVDSDIIKILENI
jgi:hypothetical protein